LLFSGCGGRYGEAAKEKEKARDHGPWRKHGIRRREAIRWWISKEYAVMYPIM
jgi:hypothetical protein